jgi:hypothetical protein
MLKQLCVLALAPLAATAINVNFDSLSAGTIVTNQYLSNNVLFTPNGSSLSGRVTNVAAGEFGAASFGNSNPMALFAADPGDILLIDFVTPDGLSPLPATNVSFLAGDGDAAPDLFRVTFFDPSLASLSVQTFSTLTAGVSVTCPGCTVRRVQIDVLSHPASPFSGMFIDDLAFDPVPEPSMSLLLLGGLAAVRFRNSQSRR